MSISVREPGKGLATCSQTLTSWKPPHEDEPLTAADQKRIIARILEAYRFMEVEASRLSRSKRGYGF